MQNDAEVRRKGGLTCTATADAKHNAAEQPALVLVVSVDFRLLDTSVETGQRDAAAVGSDAVGRQVHAADRAAVTAPDPVGAGLVAAARALMARGVARCSPRAALLTSPALYCCRTISSLDCAQSKASLAWRRLPRPGREPRGVLADRFRAARPPRPTRDCAGGRRAQSPRHERSRLKSAVRTHSSAWAATWPAVGRSWARRLDLAAMPAARPPRGCRGGRSWVAGDGCASESAAASQRAWPPSSRSCATSAGQCSNSAELWRDSA